MFSLFSNSVPELSVEEIKLSLDRRGAFTILDVRTPEEYKEGHINGSVLLSMDKVRKEIEQVIPNKDQKIIAHCRSGARSAKAVSEMKKLGYTNVYNMQGGILAWEELGLPVIKEI